MMEFILITGLSGSGRTIALHTLEDLGYYCVDNLPLALLMPFVEEFRKSHRPTDAKAAIGIDARGGVEDLKKLPQIIARIKESPLICRLIILKANPATLLKRFSETRRRHPLTNERVTLEDAIEQEWSLIHPILKYADLIVDTTATHVHELRALLHDLVEGTQRSGLSLLFRSFGFKYGLPTEADLVFDVRCLPNPHWLPRLRPLTGKDKPVADFLDQQVEVEKMIESIIRFLQEWLPCFEMERRAYLTVAIGCTGGRHRSVYLVERLAKRFQEDHRPVLIRHRELS